MEEREALKRQIELLQDLINKHKSVHGDAPFTGSEPRDLQVPTAARGRSFSTSGVSRYSSRGRPYGPQSRGSWRKTYSLRNTCPQSTEGHPSTSASSSLQQSVSQFRADDVSLPGHSRGNQANLTKTASLLSGNPSQHKGEHSKTTIKETACTKLNIDAEKQGSSPASIGARHEASQTQMFQQKLDSRLVLLPEKKTGGFLTAPSSVHTNSSMSSQSRTEIQNKLSPNSKTSTDIKKTFTSTTPTLLPAPTAPSGVLKHPSQNVSSHSIGTQVHASFLKKSKFTWVKSQTVDVDSRAASSVSSLMSRAAASSTSASKTVVSTEKPSPASFSKRTPPKKLARKLSPVAVAPKTSKYKWVSSSGLQTRTLRKPLSPKTLTLPQRSLEKGDAVRKIKAASAPSVKPKKGAAGSSGSPSSASRYCWKAGGQSASASGGAAVTRRVSAFHWTAEKNTKGTRAGFVASPTLTQRSCLMSSSPGGFKLRSRMKIIRKSASSGNASEKGGNLPSAKFSPRARLYASTRSPVGVRRTPSRELVCFGRHKLRRLSPTSLKTNPASSFHRSPASQRVFRTRYKMVTRSSSSTSMHAVHYNPALSWRAKKIQSARSFLQNRLRVPHDRHPSSSQRWTGSGMCWIRGSLYRVSANKLSRTRTANMSINRTGKSSGPHVSPALSRHLASRAVQRSIAIIRHARQKKQQKQYCMYYNRFGKCNRGTSCPFIHDPDKVAVCTRFLRGTCKQADGDCPFSHKIAKEKMPVCSYFLKGTCNNSDCPYSHVYVSRKAEVCEDFVRGYCPEGEKCKKKHTLVCPDFSKSGSCPRGPRCKLQHRQRVKRSPSSTPSTPAKKARTREPLKRPRLSIDMPQSAQAAPGTPTAGPLALPSFISLSSSPEEADAPDQPANVAQVKEKKLQIKPRL
ncbi:zinc finger CCCH domain-containing protein 3 [Kryptolebias marmoratus]|uniref:Zinc finger CCCH domain-containing protein 3 n=1 Tax=Kryptolebias marmoratus TaxID=37003 RepID=A0A3Q3B3R9_KRYMA|nr:zinc finger CCCH domain-containing protein 3 [Kryptolebias marmoratus]